MLQTRQSKQKQLRDKLAAMPDPPALYTVGEVKQWNGVGCVCLSDEVFIIQGLKVRCSTWQKPDGTLDHFYYDSNHDKNAME